MRPHDIMIYLGINKKFILGLKTAGVGDGD